MAVALGAAQLAAALDRPQASPLVVVGSAFIDLTPAWLKDFAIRTFGSDDKLVLLLGLAVVLVVVAAFAGVAAPRHPVLATAAPVVLGLVGCAAALSRPDAIVVDVVPSLVAALAGVLALHALRRAWSRVFPAVATGGEPITGYPGTAFDGASGSTGDRRTLLRGGALMIGLAALGGGAGRAVTAVRQAAADPGPLRLPAPTDPAPALPRGVDLRLTGLGPFTTPNADFYRVDTVLVVPRVPHEQWRLRVYGLVERPVELTFADLLALPLVERDITLTCVSNEVGGPYVGNARWLGADLAALLRRAGVRSGADQILSRSADGWTCGTPVQTVLDGRDALLAVGMNGRTLPPEHGFPARMLVPGLYGYASATKWVTDIKLTRFADEQAYWTRRGWAERAPIKTASRIDVPRPFAQVDAGRTMIAGTAWAQHRGVAAVEVRIDGGAWRQARLAASANLDTWRQWHLDWLAAPGRHRLEVRATDVTGHTQPDHRAPPFPDGATGWHSVVVTVR
ncbi:molybdopterin-dependent oxidoreductase [Sphaerisporangium viridialbum]|uniref:molybdopterin-dependent oxidoreductase n=1 Tax=Sphaerisporangium viridialbum TaxID=46189 RepID=UPI003C716412